MSYLQAPLRPDTLLIERAHVSCLSGRERGGEALLVSSRRRRGERGRLFD